MNVPRTMLLAALLAGCGWAAGAGETYVESFDLAGATWSEDMLDRLFSRFCVGK